MDAPECRPILVIEDDGDVREALSEFLELYGYTVVCSENGRSALAEIRTRAVSPALILLDLLMPVMDGQTFLSRARQDQRIKGVPIVVVTAHPSVEAPGASAVLRKPIKAERLLSTVRRFVREAERQSEEK
jgi:CheY-like chemotaxis protein